MTIVSKNSHITMTLGKPGRTKIMIDDVDLSNLVYRTEFVMEVNKIGRLVLHCHALNMTIQGMGDVVFDDHIDTEPSLRAAIDDAQTMQPCQVCGEPAAISVVDMVDVTTIKSKAKEYRTLFPPHHFCDEHAREPLIFRLF